MLDTPLLRHNVGSHCRCNLVYFGVPKLSNFDTQAIDKIDLTFKQQKNAKKGPPGKCTNVPGGMRGAPRRYIYYISIQYIDSILTEC